MLLFLLLSLQLFILQFKRGSHIHKISQNNNHKYQLQPFLGLLHSQPRTHTKNTYTEVSHCTKNYRMSRPRETNHREHGLATSLPLLSCSSNQNSSEHLNPNTETTLQYKETHNQSTPVPSHHDLLYSSPRGHGVMEIQHNTDYDCLSWSFSACSFSACVLMSCWSCCRLLPTNSCVNHASRCTGMRKLRMRFVKKDSTYCKRKTPQSQSLFCRGIFG